MVLLKGLFICENLQKIILKEGILRGQVHSVFKNACNIECDDLFITLLSKEKKMSPMCVIVDGGEQVDFNDLNITQGLTFEFSESEIYCTQRNFFIAMNNARIWSSRPKTKASSCSENQLLENIKIIEQELKTLGKLYGLGPLVSMFGGKQPELELVTFHECPFDKSFEFIKDRFISFINGVIKADVDGIGCLAQRVIGFGCGLTPSMDDFISGLMIAYIYMGSYYKLNRKQIYEFNSKIISLGLHKTTRVSSEMLKHSSVGETNEAVHDLMAAILNFDDADADAEENHRSIIKALKEVIGYGETSGTDTVLGIYVGLRILNNLRYRRVWQMNLCVDIRKNTYYDSVALMLITKEIKKLPYVTEVIVGMGTDLNKELSENLNLSNDDIKNLTPNDFFISASASVSQKEDNALSSIIKKVNELLNSKKEETGASDYKPNTFKAAINHLKDANLAVISLPGKYAADEARRALENGLNVMLFSDNVSIEDEIELKKIGSGKGLLVMGPDCGTAIINGVPLCFANAVKMGDIGIVGASGTGLQEVTVIIDNFGGGISQAIGTGGRDLKSEVGGIMMLEGFKALIDDPDTKVIVLVSKPPAPEVAEKILKMVDTTDKPVVVHFIGGDAEQIKKHGAYACCSLEDAGHKAVLLSKGKVAYDFTGFTQSEKEIQELVDNEISKMHVSQKYIRALYTGGTLADEAMKLLDKAGYSMYSNIPLQPELKLRYIHKSIQNTCIDLGDDDFTLGKPHPMIDPMGRVERLPKEAEDEEVAIILMDFVLGYGSNVDPAGEMLPYIIEAKKKMADKGRYLCVVGYICGTQGDPQNYKVQRDKLEAAGVILMPSNAQAVRLCEKLLNKIK